MKISNKHIVTILLAFSLLVLGVLSLSSVAEKIEKRDGLIPYKLIIDDDGDLVCIGQRAMLIPFEESEGNDSDAVRPIKAGQYIQLDSDYEELFTMTVGNQLKDGGVANSCLTNIWNIGGSKRLIYYYYETNEIKSQYKQYDELTKPRATVLEIPQSLLPGYADTLRKVSDGYLFGGYALINSKKQPMKKDDIISLYDDSLRSVWEVSGENFEGCSYSGVIETEEAFILHGAAQDLNGNSFPSICAISKAGEFLWRYDAMYFVGCTVIDGVQQRDGDTAFIIGSSASNSGSKVAKFLKLNNDGKSTYVLDIFKEHGAYNLTSIVELSSGLAISGNYMRDNQGAIVFFFHNGKRSSLKDFTIDKNSLKQTTLLVRETNDLIHAYGYVEYNDSLAQKDISQQYQSFFYGITSDDFDHKQ